MLCTESEYRERGTWFIFQAFEAYSEDFYREDSLF